MTESNSNETPQESGKRPSVASERFAQLLRAHTSSLNWIAAAWTRNRAERDDLLQEISLAIWRAIPSFRGQCSERTFVLRIAQNQSITHASRRRTASDPVDDNVASNMPNPEHSYAGAQRGAMLLEAIRQLPDGLRQVMLLALQDLSTAEIAEVVGISENNVAVRMNRARETLRKTMKGNR